MKKKELVERRDELKENFRKRRWIKKTKKRFEKNKKRIERMWKMMIGGKGGKKIVGEVKTDDWTSREIYI